MWESLDKRQNEYFHKTNFVGIPRERIAMYFLLKSQGLFTDLNNQNVTLHDIVKSKDNEGKKTITYLNITRFGMRKNPSWEFNDRMLQQLWANYDKKFQGEENLYPTPEDKDKRFLIDETLIRKVIFRLTAIGLINDVLEDYANKRLILHVTPKPAGEYYNSLQAFLERYYMPNDAAEIITGWKNDPNKSADELIDCMWRITDFIYEKVAKKRARAITDVQDFCRCGLNSRYGKTWLERNEALKDYLYYYFNSKYARSGYQNERGDAYSLYDDTEGAKRSDIEIVWKYMRVIDPEYLGSSESPKDNIKHLQGAVRLLRRATIDDNPTLALLDVFCTFMTVLPKDRADTNVFLRTLRDEGFHIIFKTTSPEVATSYVQKYFAQLKQYVKPAYEKQLLLLKMLIEADLLHSTWNENMRSTLHSVHPFKKS
jgi:ATP-dependent DNA helicase RecQ